MRKIVPKKEQKKYEKNQKALSFAGAFDYNGKCCDIDSDEA